MIILKGRSVPMSREEMQIGFNNDNAVEKRRFMLTDESLYDFDFKLDIKTANAVGIVDLEKEVTDNGIILTWEILREHLSEGRLRCQLRAFSLSDEVWHSEIADFIVGKSINATEYFSGELPSEFESIEQRITQAKNETLAARQGVEAVADNAEEAAQRAQTAADKAENAAEWLEFMLKNPDNELDFEIPTASRTRLGAVKVGEGLEVSEDGTLSVDFEAFPKYEGEYTVTPSVESQRVETANKMMQDDLTVEAIPYFETSNEKNGETVFIGYNK